MTLIITPQYGAGLFGRTITAESQFFFVDGFFQRTADELVIRGIVIEAADGIKAVFIHLQMTRKALAKLASHDGESMAPLVNQETIHQDMDRGQQLMSRINQGILREIKPKNPLVEWYYWKDKHTVSDVTEHSLFKMAQGMLSPVENDNYRLEEIEELNNAWAVYDKKLNTFFAFDPAITTLQKDEKRNRVLVVCKTRNVGCSCFY